MVTDTETTSPDTETASAEGQVAPETQETPESAPAADAATTEPQPEPQPSVDEELAKTVKAAVDAQFGEAAPEVQAGEATFTKAELDAQLERAEQSAADRAANQVRQENQRQQEIAANRGRLRAEMRRDIGESLKKIADSGEVSDGFLNDVDQRYGRAIYEEATEFVSTTIDNAAIQALSAVPGATELTEEDVSGLSRPFKTPQDRFAAFFEIAHNLGIKQGEANKAAWAEKEAAKRARVATEAATNRALAEIRSKQPGGELPKGEAAPSGKLTEADIAKMTPEEWEVNRDRYFQQQGLLKR